MAQRIQLRRGPAAQWAEVNPVLGIGEPGIETDTGRQKFGDGVTRWNDRPYASQGAKGDQGAPGVADDASVAQQVTSGAQTVAALSATIGDKIVADTPAIIAAESQRETPTTGALRRKVADAVAVVASMTGHSLMYGTYGGSGNTPPVNGSTNTRSSDSVPESMNSMLGHINYGNTKTILNNAFPGDRTSEVLSRWSGGSSGDIEFIWADANDAKNYGGFPDGALTPEQTAANTVALIKRSQARGAQPVIIGGAPAVSLNDSRRIFAAAETQRQVAQRMGVPYVRVSDLLNVVPSPRTVFWDSIHLNSPGYAAIGTRLAALMGPRGLDPLPVAPGKVILPSHHEQSGRGSITDRTNARDGNVIGLANAGASIVTFCVNATQPCDIIVWCYSEAGAGAAGVGTISHNRLLGKVGVAKKVASIAYGSGRAVPVRLGTLRGGPDVIILGCDAGTIEIEAIEFVPVRQSNITPSVGMRMVKSDITGVRVGDTNVPTGAAESVFDPLACFGITNNAMTGVAARADFTVRFAAHNTPGKLQGVALSAGNSKTADHQINGGYVALRDGTNLILREFNGAGVTNPLNVANVFPSTGAWDGVISFVFDATANLSIYVEGVQAGTAVASKFKQFFPGVLAETGFPATVLGCSIVADANSV
ncbi:hypothetical protein HWD94_03820 [Pseudarthrobacter equi]|uniref:hyaluronate lyase N-terminal domain-containing protein n=1 Tax=Pseudarthrobacter equi TaxID=728066 RepID=UPI0021C07D5F|nr:GDSL-type esterase/lipase family protein [Pseudarthrobacter equi]MCT9624251.1 hypothetical protein [Pseudarthrobacter equi]